MMLLRKLSRVFFSVGAILSLVSFPVFASPDFAELEKSVVRVYVEEANGAGSGTGFVINDQGYVGTNHHVVDGARRIFVITNRSGRGIPAEVAWSSRELDLAVLKVSPSGELRPAVFSRAAVEKGAIAHALGFPGLADRMGVAMDATVTSGNIGRLFRGSWGGQELAIIQHSASINPGNSGGPLFDDCGAIIGINTQGSGAGRIVRGPDGTVIDIMSGSGVFFASAVGELLRELPALGITFQDSAETCSTDAVAAGVEEARRELGAWTDKFFVWGAGLTLMIFAALILALRKPRETVVRVVERYGEQLSSVVKDSFVARKRHSWKLSLSGRDSSGVPIKVEFSSADFLSDEKGLIIGRHPMLVHRVIDADGISRRHLRVRRVGAGFAIEDLNSSNGSCLNGKKLAPYSPETIVVGDRLQFGSVELAVAGV